jgi:3-oxoacyl-[acyl-carrier protein] reductase
MEIKNKVALVTGASGGIGKAIAITLAKQKAQVIINYKSNDSAAKQVLAECNKFSNGNSIIKANITNDAEVQKMFEEINKKYSHLDILVNNAGIFDETDSAINLEAFENTFNTNFLSQIRIIKYSLALMKQGKIISISSVHGKLGHGRPTAAAYSSMKAALDNYTKNLAKELAPKIIVNAISPGRTLTPMWGNMSKSEEKELAKDQLINRFILPDEVADAALFLIKNDAVCGEILTIDGGMSLKTLG